MNIFKILGRKAKINLQSKLYGLLVSVKIILDKILYLGVKPFCTEPYLSRSLIRRFIPGDKGSALDQPLGVHITYSLC